RYRCHGWPPARRAWRSWRGADPALPVREAMLRGGPGWTGANHQKLPELVDELAAATMMMMAIARAEMPTSTKPTMAHVLAVLPVLGLAVLRLSVLRLSVLRLSVLRLAVRRRRRARLAVAGLGRVRSLRSLRPLRLLRPRTAGTRAAGRARGPRRRRRGAGRIHRQVGAAAAADVRAALPPSPPEQGEPFEAVLGDLDRAILPGITHWQSPRFFAFFPGNASGPAILGELLSAGLGVQGMLWASSPGCTEVETLML